MKRFAFSMSEELFAALQRRARERGTSVAAVLREAAEKDVLPPQPWPEGAGMFSSGYTDTSRLASEGRVPPRRQPVPKSLGMANSGHTDTARLAGDERARYHSFRYDS